MRGQIINKVTLATRVKVKSLKVKFIIEETTILPTIEWSFFSCFTRDDKANIGEILNRCFYSLFSATTIKTTTDKNFDHVHIWSGKKNGQVLSYTIIYDQMDVKLIIIKNTLKKLFLSSELIFEGAGLEFKMLKTTKVQSSESNISIDKF